MSTTAGFQWGVKLGDKPKFNEKPVGKTNSNLSPIRKRRLDEERTKVTKVNKTRNISQPSHHTSISQMHKRAKIPIIRGEKLPVNRLIETLNHSSVNSLLEHLVKVHPEIIPTIYEIQPKITLNDAINTTKRKFTDIKENLPYKGDIENDYSYLRIKPYLNEFLNCLSDFILNFLPPVEQDLMNSLMFLDYTTNLVNELPNFTNNEFKYIKAKCYEQISNTWLIVLNKIYDTLEPQTDNPEARLFNFVKIINELDLKDKLAKYNEFSKKEFDKVIDFISAKINDYEPALNDNGAGDILNDLISVDYSNYSLTANSSV